MKIVTTCRPVSLFRGLLFFLAVMVAAPGAWSIEVLYDFDDRSELKDWSLRTPGQDTLEITKRFSSPGSGSLRFTTPKWEAGMEQWAAMNARFEAEDFSGHDRLVVELVNASSDAVGLRMLMTDPRVEVQQGFKATATVEPLARHQWVIDISQTNPGEARKIDLSQVVHLHFWTTRPSSDVEVYIDRIYLAGKDEALPEADPRLGKQVVGLLRDSEGLRDGRRLLKELEQWRDGADGDEARWLDGVREEARERVDAVESTIDRGAELSDDQRQELFVQIDNLGRYRERVRSLRQLRAQGQAATPGPWQDTLLATVSSMQKVMPRDAALPAPLDRSGRVELALAQNEREGFQVVVLPFLESLEGVAVDVGELTDEQGRALPDGAVSVEPVGYVETYLPHHPLTSYGQYVGWWPDPLLPFLEEVDVQRGDAQTFFVRLKTDKQTPAGTYRGKVEVTAEGRDQPHELDLSVTVHGFVLPDRSPLPLAMNFEPNFVKLIMQAAEPGLTEEQWQERWETLKFDWADFLADHYITYDSIYNNGSGWPDFEVLDHLAERGKLDMFNLGHYGFEQPDGSGIMDQKLKEQLPAIRDAYDQAESRGWLDRAYIYGFDERPEENFPAMEAYTARMKKHLPEEPGVHAFTTAGAYWDYWGEADHIDWWCPIIGLFDREKAEKLREQGKQVWWYVCIASPPPYPNVFIDQPVIDTRMMMGVMTAKYRPDGFLYYMLNSFHRPDWEMNVNKGYITSGPFTDWNPKSFRESHGDGNLMYPGPDARPLPNLRLENFRDGLEDYAYVLELEQRIARVREADDASAEQRRWARRAESLVEVPEHLVRELNDFSREPAEVYAYRAKLAEAIESFPAPEPSE